MGMNWGSEAPAEESCRHIDSGQAWRLMQEQDALVVDVREPHELLQGRIPDAQHIPLRQIVHHVENLKQHENRPIILSCRTGHRSEVVCRYLRQHGFRNLYNLAGGIMGWRTANLPVSE